MAVGENYELELHIEGQGATELNLDVTPQPTMTLNLGTTPGDPDGISARNAEAWAVGKRNGVPVASSDPTYHNNSKWYAEQLDAAVNFPYIDDVTGNWMVYDPEQGEYVDTGIHAKGDPGEGVPSGGTYGQVLRKNSSTDYDASWGDEQDITGKADKVSNATTGNFAALDGSGNLVDSGHKHGDYVTDVSGKADKVVDAVDGNLAGLDEYGNLTDSGISPTTVAGKATKVSGATAGNFAGLDSNGNLTDSGHKHSDYLTSHQDVSGKVDQEEVATIESGSTASRNYEVGEILWRSGIPYQVISAISSGDAFSSSNISVVQNGVANSLATRTNDVADDLYDLSLDVTAVTGDVSDLTDELARICIAGENMAITGNGTQTISLEGLTENHRVCNWGLTVGDPANPPATIEITESAGEYTIAITNFGGTSFYIRPVFILPQN